MLLQRNPFLHYVDDFEKEAEEFLKKYNCEDAIENPQQIPIEDIARKLMSLDIIDSECLSADETAQGAIAFFDGIIDVYDEASGGMVGYEVTQPSIFVDARIINLGRYRNTVAHECFHWWRHRNYFNFNRTHEKATEFGIRCERTSPRKDIGENQWTDVERMEWQARTIAPKILMPEKATRKKIDALYHDLLNGKGEENKPFYVEQVISRIASFFKVSRQSAAIRMTELGYEEAREYSGNEREEKAITVERVKNLLLNYPEKKVSKAKKRQQPITPVEAFRIIQRNDTLREIFDTHAVVYADGYFTLRNDDFILIDEGEAHLSDYTKAHLAECTLDFTKKLCLKPYLTHDASAYMMFRSDTEFQEKTTFDSNTQNIEFFNRAKDFENRFARYASIQKTANELLMDYINISRWSKATFLSKTELDDMSWNRVKDKNYKFTIRPLVTIGKALDLSADEMEEVLNAAGLSLKKPDKEIRAYQYLFSFPGMSIHDCNKLLDEIGDVPRLGSQERKIRKKTAGTK